MQHLGMDCAIHLSLGPYVIMSCVVCREGMESAQAVLNKFKADVLQRCAAISGEEGAQT